MPQERPDTDWEAWLKLAQNSSFSFLYTEPDLYEEEVAKTLDDTFRPDDSPPMPELTFDGLDKLAKVAPSMVPTLLECTPVDFMELPLEHFQKLCDKQGYGKVISSLTYVQNITSRNDPLIVQRVLGLKAALKESRTTPAAESRNTPSSQSAGEDASENPVAS